MHAHTSGIMQASRQQTEEQSLKVKSNFLLTKYHAVVQDSPEGSQSTRHGEH